MGRTSRAKSNERALKEHASIWGRPDPGLWRKVRISNKPNTLESASEMRLKQAQFGIHCLYNAQQKSIKHNSCALPENTSGSTSILGIKYLGLGFY